LGQKRLRVFLAKQTADIIGEENKSLAPDNQFFVFEELLDIPIRTSVKTSAVKVELLSKLVDIFESLGLPNNPK